VDGRRLLSGQPLAKPPAALRRLTLSESLADAITEAIATGAIAPGERLVEIPLAERLGVSRVPLREALKILSAQGILVGGGHRGYSVIAFDERTLQRIDEIRLPVETVLLHDALERWRDQPEGLYRLDEAVEVMASKARLGDRRGMSLADLDLHRVIRKAAQNEIAGTVWDTLARHLDIAFSLQDYGKGRLADFVALHAAFRDRIRQLIDRRPGEAEIRAAIEEHVTTLRTRPPR
jgi:DNA-binding GntR family transcriptional regulator